MPGGASPSNERDAAADVARDGPRNAPAVTTLWVLVFGYLTLALLCVGIDTVFHFTGSPIDGPFQLFNALRRIEAGQRIGVGFQFFHGPAVPYLHFALFRILGGSFFASEAARQIVSLSFFILSYAVVFFAWTRSATSALRLTVAAMLATIMFRMDALFLPINSMLGVRSTMPLLIAAALAARFRPRARIILVGVSVGVALLVATEQGLATIAALVTAAIIVGASGQRPRAVASQLGATLAIGAATYCAVLVVLGGPAGFIGALHYNFGIVPKDQFWYFGGPPNRFLFSLRQFLSYPWILVFLAVIGAACAASVVRYLKHSDAADDALRAELFLGLYAAFSIVPIFGTFVEVYLQPGVRAGLILGLLAVRRWGKARPARGGATEQRWFSRGAGLGVTALGLATVGLRPMASHITLAAPLHVFVAHVLEGDPPAMSPDWASVAHKGSALVDDIQRRTQRSPVIWSTYAGIVEANAGVFNPSFDYLIHALGPVNRRLYTKTFEAVHPDLVQTIRPSYGSVSYEEWLEDNHWEFYRELLRTDTIAAKTAWSFFWEPRQRPFDEAPTIVAEGGLNTQQHGIALTVESPAESVTVLEVRLRYHVNNPYAKLPFFGGLPRYIIDVTGAANRNPLSLAPYETERRFPVLVRGTATVSLAFSTKSLLPGAGLVVDSVRVTRIQVAPQNRAWIADFIAPRRTAPPAP